MMDTRSEIWRAAGVLVANAGDAAPGYASRWSHTLLEAGDVESRTHWLRVMVACKALLSAGYGASKPE